MANQDKPKLHELAPPHMKKPKADKSKSTTPAAPQAPQVQPGK